MAKLTSTNVTILKSWTEGGVTGKKRKARTVKVFEGSWGSPTNSLPASAFGLNVIEECSTVIYTAGTNLVNGIDATAIPYLGIPLPDWAAANVSAGNTQLILATKFGSPASESTDIVLQDGYYLQFTVKGY